MYTYYINFNKYVSATIGNHQLNLDISITAKMNVINVWTCCDKGIWTQIMHVNDKHVCFFYKFLQSSVLVPNLYGVNPGFSFLSIAFEYNIFDNQSNFLSNVFPWSIMKNPTIEQHFQILLFYAVVSTYLITEWQTVQNWSDSLIASKWRQSSNWPLLQIL